LHPFAKLLNDKSITNLMDEMTSPINSGYMNVKNKGEMESILSGTQPAGRMVPQMVDASHQRSRKVLGNACSNNKTLLKSTSSKTLLVN